MKIADLNAAIKILELTAHSCVNKVHNQMQTDEEAHREIQKEWENFWVELTKKRKRKSLPSRNG